MFENGTLGLELNNDVTLDNISDDREMLGAKEYTETVLGLNWDEVMEDNDHGHELMSYAMEKWNEYAAQFDSDAAGIDDNLDANNIITDNLESNLNTPMSFYEYMEKVEGVDRETFDENYDGSLYDEAYYRYYNYVDPNPLKDFYNQLGNKDFDPVEYIREIANYSNNYYDEKFKEVTQLMYVDQNPAFHPEGDVFEHTVMVLENAHEISSQTSNPKLFELAALAHDFGKATTTQFNEKKGTWVAYGHDKAGIELANRFIDRIGKEAELSAQEIAEAKNYVANMTELHMQPNQLASNDKAKDTSFNKMFDQSVNTKDLIKLAMCDALGSASKDKALEYQTILEDKLDKYNELMQQPHVTKEMLQGMNVPEDKINKMHDFAHKLHVSGLDLDKQLRQTFGQFKMELTKDMLDNATMKDDRSHVESIETKTVQEFASILREDRSSLKYQMTNHAVLGNKTIISISISADDYGLMNERDDNGNLSRVEVHVKADAPSTDKLLNEYIKDDSNRYESKAAVIANTSYNYNGEKWLALGYVDINMLENFVKDHGGIIGYESEKVGQAIDFNGNVTTILSSEEIAKQSVEKYNSILDQMNRIKEFYDRNPQDKAIEMQKLKELESDIKKAGYTMNKTENGYEIQKDDSQYVRECLTNAANVRDNPNEPSLLDYVVNQRLDGPTHAGSDFGIKDNVELTKKLYQAEWHEIKDPNVGGNKRVFEAEIPGNVGICSIVNIPEGTTLYAIDPKHTGNVMIGAANIPKTETEVSHIIISPATEPGQKDVVVTAFPGPIVADQSIPATELQHGTAVTIEEAKAYGFDTVKFISPEMEHELSLINQEIEAAERNRDTDQNIDTQSNDTRNDWDPLCDD